MTYSDLENRLPDEALIAVRNTIVLTSIVGIVAGIVALVWPHATMLVIAVLFAISLFCIGAFRLYLAFAGKDLSGAWRVVHGVLGFIILIAGIIALVRPGQSLAMLAVFIGVGWIFSGLGEIFSASDNPYAPKWLLIVSGIVSVIAGIVMIAFSWVALATLVWVSAIMLIAMSIANLFTLPKRAPAAAV
ncbi:HdeD family acid-resistance protein [Gordonia sp. (in: high G+C Gram-positive bacteria)]|jgi:hypothetical protein|uniref:HdeD family acid-resistance protein n=1 Tax=Gordonia sp. (in: high G+C Gram-positive bacteria) TaxID=84139 RepID=UPI002605414C|nr:DUF308 domain-containing protein [Gordonia sp. (in: high G+C Gram-positive bacteria)]HMS74796.1 DUF308 domain-containing protein [Gordonia sp. (in: high G+C Gram-positive bacteria)]